jgi:modulator of FtsH protease HflK
VTRQRLYLETMERVLGGTDKTIIDTGGQPGPGVVPYLLNSPPRERPTQQSQSGGNQ